MQIVYIIYSKINVEYLKSKKDYIKSTNMYIYLKGLIFDLASSYNLKYVTITTFFIITASVYIFSYILFYNIFQSVIPSLLISAFISILPYSFIKYLLNKRKKDILRTFPTYVLSLKNYTDVDNNIIFAINQSSPNKIFGKYIEKFNVSVSKGVNVYTAFEDLKKDIKIKEISNFITLLQNCYTNGGNFSKVIEKYSKFQSRINIQKEKENQNLLSSKITLVVLVILNVLLLFGFVLKNEEYKDIILNSTSGQIILCLNILTYFFMYVIYMKLCKMEE